MLKFFTDVKILKSLHEASVLSDMNYFLCTWRFLEMINILNKSFVDLQVCWRCQLI